MMTSRITAWLIAALVVAPASARATLQIDFYEDTVLVDTVVDGDPEDSNANTDLIEIASGTFGNLAVTNVRCREKIPPPLSRAMVQFNGSCCGPAEFQNVDPSNPHAYNVICSGTAFGALAANLYKFKVHYGRGTGDDALAGPINIDPHSFTGTAVGSSAQTLTGLALVGTPPIDFPKQKFKTIAALPVSQLTADLDMSLDVDDRLIVHKAKVSVNRRIACPSKQANCTGRAVKALFKCHIKAEKKGLPIDVACLDAASDKFDGGANPADGCFEKFEAKYAAAGPTACYSYGEQANTAALIDSFVLAVVTNVDPGYPAPVLDKCAARKKLCAANKQKKLLKCYSRALNKDEEVSEDCITKVHDQFSKCYTKADLNIGPCSGSLATIETLVDDFVRDSTCVIMPEADVPDSQGDCP